MPSRQADGEIGNERARLDSVLAQREQDVIETLKRQNAQWFADESQKLEKWELKREARSAGSPEQQHRIQTQIQEQEKSKRRLRQRIFEVEDEIIEERDRMISDLEARLQQDISKQELFAVRWTVV